MTDANDQQVPQPESTPATHREPMQQPAQQPGQAPQWIPVAPPPNPYASVPGGGKGLAITTMVLGLVALLTAVVSAFYFSFYVLLGALLGLVAIVLGIVALVKRSRPPAASITGLIAGILAVVVAVVGGVLALGALLSPGFTSSNEGSSSDEGGTWSPEAEQEVLLDWPANMATGGVVFEQGEGSDPVVRLSDAPSDGIPGTTSVDREGDVADIMLYFDYRCPHCMDFEDVNAALLTDLVSSGAATLEIVPLSFVDSAYSPPMAGALACVVDGQPEGAWAAHTALLGYEARVTDPTSEVLISVIDSAVGGIDPTVSDCIETGRFVPFIQGLNTWVTSNPVPNALDESLRVTGTPLAVVNGVPYPGAPSDAQAFRQFFEDQLG